jgi:prophage regulatory protein
MAKTGMSRTTIWKLERQGDFPKSFLITPRCAVWFEHEVDEWLARRPASPAAAAPGPDHTLRKRFPGRGKSEGVR